MLLTNATASSPISVPDNSAAIAAAATVVLALATFYLAWEARNQRRRGEREEKEQRFQEHSRILYQSFDTSVTNKTIAGWTRKGIADFEMATQLLQHLYTGHRRIYDFYSAVLNLQSEYNEKSEKMLQDVERQVRGLARSTGINENRTTATPSCDAKAIAFYIRNYAGSDVWRPFRVEQTGQELFEVLDGQTFASFPVVPLAPEEREPAESLVRQLAESFTDALNRIAQSAKLVEYSTTKRELIQKIGSDEIELDKLMKDLLDHARLGGEFDSANEGCRSCLRFHSAKDELFLRREMDACPLTKKPSASSPILS